MSISQAPRAIASKNIDLIGYNDLKERPAFKIAMQEVNGRFYLYLSHFWVSGWSVIDVTEPDKPEYLNFIIFKFSLIHEVITDRFGISSRIGFRVCFCFLKN